SNRKSTRQTKTYWQDPRKAKIHGENSKIKEYSPELLPSTKCPGKRKKAKVSQCYWVSKRKLLDRLAEK
ncbi:9388_t:CDS:2, partial [Dentiscutata heterogama]